jgi:hypothetical protein
MDLSYCYSVYTHCNVVPTCHYFSSLHSGLIPTYPYINLQDAKVTMLGLVPSIARAWKNTDCTAGFDWSTIR